jgi:carbamoyl-phosphate synthase small subunit
LDIESWKSHVSGFVIRELSPVISNWRAEGSLQDYLREHAIPGIQGVDTRALTKKLRTRGAMNGLISTEGLSTEEAVDRARKWPGLVGVDYVKEVTHTAPFNWDEPDLQSWNFSLIQGSNPGDPKNVHLPLPPADIPIVAYDFGIKYNILRRLRQKGFRVRVVPATTSAEEALKSKPAGIFLSNGPGDPSALPYAAKAIGELITKGIPIFGICLGHQILGLALGGRTYKLKFGHRGGNQPVKDLETGSVEITSQNHGFAVDPKSLPSEVVVDRINLNDHTVEGLHHCQKPIFCVQYHPEASPGPHDSTSLFDRFRKLVEKS